MKHFLSISILLLLCLTSCTDDKAVLTILDRAEAVMEEYPDSAYQLLCQADSTIADQSKKTRMRHLLLTAEATNKCDYPMPDDSLFMEVTDYYDNHGTPNQQLKAHYLLGCIYRDMKEAPQAIQCYYDAVEKADTLSEDCDYTTLFRVYGQMANVFHSQIMPDEQLKAERMYSEYALKAGNTYEYIHGIELLVFPYSQKGDTAMILSTEELAHDLYLANGYTKAAAGAYTTSMYIYIARKDFKKVHQLMQLFEKESGLFDSEGNIKKGREHYYYCKGLYYLGLHQLDSAETYFKKLLRYGYSFDAYRGLLAVCQEKNDGVSALTYTKLYTATFDTLVTDIHAEATRQAVGMYDYTRNQKIAMDRQREADRTKFLLILFILVFIVVAIIAFWQYQRFKHKKLFEITRLNNRYINTSLHYKKLQEELHNVQDTYLERLSEKQNELKILEQRLLDYQKQYERLTSVDKEEALMQSDIVAVFQTKTKPKYHHSLPSFSDWENLFAIIKQCLPIFYAKIIKDPILSRQELQTCVLTRLNFSTGDIAILLDTQVQRITNAKASANRKLFSDNGATTLSKNLRHL